MDRKSRISNRNVERERERKEYELWRNENVSFFSRMLNRKRLYCRNTINYSFGIFLACLALPLITSHEEHSSLAREERRNHT